MSLPHYFLAVPLPPDVKQHIHSWAHEEKKSLDFKKWVHPEDYHITLYFLGAVEKRKLDDIIFKMKDTDSSVSTFSLHLTDAGYFGASSHPRIYWVGVNRPKSLQNLQQIVSSEMVSLGFEEEKREYRPHITVARKWQGKESYQQKKSLISSPITPVEWTVKEFVLFRTHLHREPKYERVETFRLQKG